MVEIHGAKQGDTVLDVACGPGFWTELLVEQVGPHGHVSGVDIDSELIRYAQESHADLIAQKRVNFRVADMRSLPFEDNSFDTVICGNAYNYLSKEELPKAIQEHMRVVRPGGRLSIRTFDNTMSLYHPVTSTVLLSVMHGMAKNLQQQRNFDNYLGRKMHGLLTQLSLGPVTTHTFVTQKTQPLCKWSLEYVQMKALWCAEKADGYCPAEDLKIWCELFDPKSPQYILARPDFYFNTTEMISLVAKPEVS
ncbi:hypothetical protein PSDVSF_14130 [Pseudodesulfovibrio sediminis]|uniref:Methyltransferase domain-containing protein n=2 Tax=Pseudodesulfovibrio sediminis TaxID=2810563 RepID=A0ABN6EP45_9BACT|nr:hypothetical protein PSDVSF_14130 [Pseudodesulfovibrio sediminis]